MYNRGEVIIIIFRVLGCHGPYPPAGGACSGYLISAEGYNLLLDCGNGVLSRLREHLCFFDLQALLLSHLHADHICDAMIMRYGLQMALEKGQRVSPLKLYAPGEPRPVFDCLAYKEAYALKSVVSKMTIEEGPFKVSFLEAAHSVPSMAMRLETPAGVLVYSSDTEYFSGLAHFAADADLFLCEASYLEKEIEKGETNHLSAAQAGQIAAEAKVKKLLLTHLHPERDPALTLFEAAKYFPEARLAYEGQVLEI